MRWERIESEKLGGNWAQSFSVVRNNEVFLRIVGDGTVYRIMTATADENLGHYRVCQDTERLWDAAVLLSEKHNGAPEESRDLQGRPYVRLFYLQQDEGVSDVRFTKELDDLTDEFFAIFDNMSASSN